MNKKYCLLAIAISASSCISAQPIEPILVSLSNAEKNIDIQMGKYEVTVAEFSEFAKETGFKATQECHLYNAHSLPAKPSGGWDDKDLISNPYRPAVCTGTDGALAYASWLAKKTNKPYRLPTFEEWKFAASAGKPSRFAFGEDFNLSEICEYENVEDFANAAGLKQHHNDRHSYTANCNDGAIYHTVVGMYRSNPFGLHDMMGNVRELLNDCVEYDANKPEQCKAHVVAGAGWHWVPRPVNVVGTMATGFYGSIEGFRLVLDSNKAIKPSADTKTFARNLEEAQQQQRKRHQQLKSIPKAPQNLTAKILDKNKVELSWQAEKGEGILYSLYRSYLDLDNKVSRKWSKIAENISHTKFVDNLPGAGSASYQIFANSAVGESMASKTLYVGQAPKYSLSQRIQAEHFVQQRFTYIRDRETEQSVGAQPNTGHYPPERSPVLPAWVKFDFNSNYQGAVKLTARLQGATQAQVEFWQGHHLIGIVEVKDDEGFKEFQIPASVITGDYPIEVRSGNKKWFAMDWFELQPDV